MSQNVLDKAKDFIYRHARLLDRRRYEYLFAGGSREAVLDVLRGYQNEDGGFGHALEPDMRCPYSQPVATEMALYHMVELGSSDERIMEGMYRYLANITLPEGGLPFVHRSVLEYPHAPWWITDRDDVPSINPTGNIIGLLWKLKQHDKLADDAWFHLCEAFVWRTIQSTDRPAGYHDGIQWVTFLANSPEPSKAAEWMCKLDAWLEAPGTIERDPEAQGYVHKVLDYAPSADSYARKFMSDRELEIHLEHLIAEQQEDGGWPISWETASPAVTNEWRGHLTIERLKTLQSYGRLL